MIWLLTAGLATFMAVQWILVRRFEKYVAHNKAPDEIAAFQPAVAVVLCARGADPHLEACLIALAQQDWPDYRVVFVTDHAQDPAVEVFHSVQKAKAMDRIEHWVAGEHGLDRSLKCNSLAWACERLDSRHDVIALIDADVVPESQWLRRLMSPLSEPSVAASFGMRWFEPLSPRIGSQVRAIWNAAAIVQMQAYSIAWGGSLAIRRQALEKCGLLDRWRRSLFEDVMIAPLLAKEGLATRMCRDLVVVSQESTILASAARWMTRQLLDVKLYHPSWPLVFLHGLLTGILPSAVLVLGIVYFLVGRWGLGALCLVLFFGFQALNIALLRRIEKSVSAARQFDSAADHGPTNRGDWFMWMLLPITQMTHLAAAIGAAIKRRITWRGVAYEFRGGQIVRLREYIPLSTIVGSNPSTDPATHSID